jgi:hypothetical protein
MAGNDGRSHENDTYAAYDGQVSEAELGTLQPSPTWSQESAQGDGDYASSVVRHAYEYARQQQQERAQGMEQRGDTVQGRQSGLAESHRQTDQAKDTRAYAQSKEEQTSLSALHKDQARREETAVSAALSDDQSKMKDALRQRTEQTTERDTKAKQQEQQRGKEKQHDKGPSQER